MNQIRILDSKVAYTQLTIPDYYTLTGNIISNDWYEKFTNSRGRPDLSLISVLSEIVYWYRPKRIKDSQTGNTTYVNKFLGNAWQTSYEHFEKKFGFHREKLRRIFIKLEQMGVCYREFRNVKLRGQTYNNRLFIHLSSQFLISCTGNKKFTEPQTHKNHVNIDFSTPKKEGGSPHFRGDYLIDNQNKNSIFKNRSMESNFCHNSFKKEKLLKKSIRLDFNEAKPLKDFYPLNKDDASRLQILSGRDFSLNAMNEILLDMSKRLTDRYFKSKKSFLSYMGKVFCYEKRDAVKINNDSFKIRNNLNLEEIGTKEIEEYLSRIEEGREISQQGILKKKLAAGLAPKTAYDLLRAYKTEDIRDGTFYLHLSTHVEITTSEKGQILQEIRSIYRQDHITDKELVYIHELQIVMPSKTNITSIYQNKMENSSLPVGIWGRVRQGLVEAYGEATDRNWFSKLTANVDEEKREIKLKAANDFIKDWIETNYLQTIERIVNLEQFKVCFCYVERQLY
ncbi:MAG: hypothetical protein FJX70_05030 [Alphaproteobacteria bacterium]|nr:hypothetical protein [Alphaproteobacteria bacterium]